MKEILDKISSYNLFNYLLPGVLFAFIASKMTGINLVQNDLIIGAFVYYFIGLVISRFGSLVIEPILKKTKFVSFADYKDFVTVSQSDTKLDTLSEANNMYRTLMAMFLLLILSGIYSWLTLKFPIIKEWSTILLVILLFIMFLFSYKKQTNYITKRIKSNLK
ncbi:MAG: hypothetical protein A2X13_11335 [Bacteroidetes bacterium GWC2_33_15]|nr:MAG: hypothetical protein A2X10_12730 [Bacteroidetes bacterium GWA2_33_15]OFX52380.1 MAG: hypothetical protein A2X13_11335 [Bacteroidetes bacterium GWC2_33_15]OFX64529.1 MAG: hypothetical protein A2X15_14190 [Bacteroidetes bacterium GWB2_32_14]OFX68935.1 MAG: hypothetical protein A2X14_08605 [Bacteroidetes bacterium GWD2_33_33]